jgi:hypothetical protein
MIKLGDTIRFPEQKDLPSGAGKVLYFNCDQSRIFVEALFGPADGERYWFPVSWLSEGDVLNDT